jgi:hypothetical protein
VVHTVVPDDSRRVGLVESGARALLASTGRAAGLEVRLDA